MHPADPSPVDHTSKHMPEPVPAAAGGQRQPSPHQGLILSARGDAADNVEHRAAGERHRSYRPGV